jgi:hypothetical protein
MIERFASPLAGNDNRDPYGTPEGAYFQILRARKRHLRHDTGSMTPDAQRQWRAVLDGLNQAEQAILPWLGRKSPRRRGSAPPARGIAGRLGALALRLLGARLGARAGRRRI